MKNKKTMFAALCVLLVLAVGVGVLWGFRKNAENADEIQWIETVDDLVSRSVAAEIGSTHSAAIKEREGLEDTEIVYAYTNADCLAWLLSGKADAVATDPLTAQILVGRYDGLKILDEILAKSSYAFAFRQGDPLRDRFDGVIRQMIEDGRMREIVARWTSENAENNDHHKETKNEEDTSAAGAPLSGKNGVLICMVDPEIEPLCFRDETGTVVGIEADILDEAAGELGYEIEYQDREFDDLIPSLMAGQADLIASAITVTEKRAELVDFTEGYLETGTALIVRTDGGSGEAAGLLLSIRNSFDRVFLKEDRWKDMLNGLLTSVIFIMTTVAIGAICGFALFLGYLRGLAPLKWIAEKFSLILTLMPLSTWLLICYYLFFRGGSKGYPAAVAAFSVNFTLTVYGRFCSCYEAIPQGQIDAARVMGYKRGSFLSRIIFPRVLPEFLSGIEADVMYHIRDTSLVGFVAVTDIQAVADAISAQTAEPFFPLILTALAYIGMNLLAGAALRGIRTRLFPSATTEAQIKKRIFREKRFGGSGRSGE